MNLNKRYKALRGKTEQSMGQLAVVQQAMNERVAAGVDGVVVPAADGVAPIPDGSDDQQWPPPPPGFPPQVHGQARQAEAVRDQIPIIHCLATPAAAATAAAAAIRPGNPALVPPAEAVTTAPTRVANPFTFTSHNYSQPIPQVPALQQGFMLTHQHAGLSAAAAVSRPLVRTRSRIRLPAERTIRDGPIFGAIRRHVESAAAAAARRQCQTIGDESTSNSPPGTALRGPGRKFLGNELLADFAG
jgi:hypothetical protein